MNMKKLCGSNRLKFKDDQGNMPPHCLSLCPAGVRGVDEGARGPPQRALLAVRLQAGPGRGPPQGDAVAKRRALPVRGRGEKVTIRPYRWRLLCKFLDSFEAVLFLQTGQF